jgi:hypothetical protein
MIVGLTAVRVAPEGQSAEFLRTVHGLALAASPVEVLGRMEPGGPGPVAVETILRTLVGLGDVTGAPSGVILRPFAHDAIERGRWRCLGSLFGEKGLGAFALDRARGPQDPQRAAWDGATAEGIEAIDPRLIAAGAIITVSGTYPSLPTTRSVVFTTGNDVQGAEVVKSAKGKLQVKVPASARSGWLGFSDTALIAASNRYRQGVRDFWRAMQLPSTVARSNSFLDCMREAPVPVDVIPDIGRGDPAHLLSLPPRTGANRVTAGLPLIETAVLGPSTVEPGGTLTLSWTSDGAFVRLDGGQRLDAAGSITLTAPPQDGPVEHTLVPFREQDGAAVGGAPVVVRASVRTSVHLGEVAADQEGRPAPFVAGQPVTVRVTVTPALATPAPITLALGDRTLTPLTTQAGLVTFEIPAHDVNAGQPLRFSVNLEKAAGAANERRDAGPFVVLDARRVRLVLFRPTVLGDGGDARIDDEQRDALLALLQRRLGLALEVQELPWADDPLAVLGSPLGGKVDPRVTYLLEMLARAAARTAGLEDAIWTLLVPPGAASDRKNNGDKRAVLSTGRLAGFEVHLPAEAAALVAVCDPAGLATLLATVAPAAPATATIPRVDASPGSAPTPPVDGANGPGALVGHVSADGDLFLEPASDDDTAGVVPSGLRVQDGPLRRLRLIGRLFADGQLRLEPPREEIRRVGPGGPHDSGLRAVLLDSDGTELGRAPVRRTTPGHFGAFALLLPVSPEVASVELRGPGGVVLRELRRTLGQPRVALVGFDDDSGSLHWTYAHTRLARPTIEIELVRGGAVPILSVDPCEGTTILPRHRLPDLDGLRVRVVASDGWNAAVSQEVALPAESERILIRRINAGLFWAETNLDGPLQWTLNGRQLSPRGGDGRLLQLDPEATGVLAVSTRPSAPAVDDSRILDGRPDA